MTLVESPAAPATTMMATVTAPIRRSSSPTAVRRSPSPPPSASPARRDRDRSGSRPHDGKGKENAEQGCDPQLQHHPHPHNYSQSPADCKRASSPSASPSCSSARKRRLDGTPVASPAERDAGAAMDVGVLGSQRRPRRNSMSHQHHHNRSASPSPSRHEEEEDDDAPVEAETAAPEPRGEEAEAEPEGEGRGLHRSALEDSRVNEEGDNWDVPCGFNEAAKRTLRIEYWDRTRECKERKWDHMDHIDATYPSREAWIWQSVLHEAEVVLEPNMFPYNTPRGIEHWTLWARRELTLAEVEEYVLGWIARARPEVTRWNLDENAQRSIDIYHVHVYFQVVPDAEVGPNPPREPRRYDDGDEEDEAADAQHEQQPEEEGREVKRPCRRNEGESESSPAHDVPSAPTSSSITGHVAEPEQPPAGAAPSPSST